MRTCFFFLAPLFLSLQLSAQNNVSGKWKGEWSDKEGFYFTFILTLEEDSVGDVKGVFKWKLIFSPRFDLKSKQGLFSKEFVEGHYDSKSRELYLEGVTMDNPHHIIAMDIYKLKLSKNGKVLEGITDNHETWNGVLYGVRMERKENVDKNKKELEGRKVVKIDKIHVDSSRVKIQFWDKYKEDGDIISLNLNGVWVLKSQEVKKTKAEVDIRLIEGNNHLVLHAENLGRMPPNTAVITVLEGGKEKVTLTLNSDMNKSEAIILHLK